MDEAYCDDSENVLRSLYDTEWDGRRVLPKAIADSALSVSRLKIYSLDQIFAIFHRDFDSRASVVAALEMNVGSISVLSEKYYKSNKQIKDETPLRVRIDPTPTNKAHAEFDRKVTIGLAKELAMSGEVQKGNVLLKYLYIFSQWFGLGPELGALLAPKIE